MLYDHKIHSLPVQDSATKQFTAFLDLSDIVAHLFSCFSSEEIEHLRIPTITEWKGEFIQVIGEKEHYATNRDIPDPKKIQQFASKIVGDVAKGPYVTVAEKGHLIDVVSAMLASSSKDRSLHRVGLESEPKHLNKIVTQSDIIKFIRSQDIGEAANLTVQQLHLGTGSEDIVKVDKSIVALEAFKLMNEKHIEGLPVVDKDNKVVGNISMSDLKLILFNASEMLYLYLAAGEYLEKAHKKDQSLPASNVSVTQASTLKEVLDTFVQNRVHRVYVVDADHKLTGLITMGDVLRTIVDSKL